MTPSRPTLRAIAATTLLLLVAAVPLLANGGTVRVSREIVGPYLVSVFTSPTPLRTGEVDVSVLVQDTIREAVLDVPVAVLALPVGFVAAPIRHEATRRQATNRLFKAAKFPIDVPGEWELRVQVGGAASGGEGGGGGGGGGVGGEVAFSVVLTDPTILDRPYLLAALILLPLLLLGWLLLGREEEGGDGSGRQSRMAATM